MTIVKSVLKPASRQSSRQLRVSPKSALAPDLRLNQETEMARQVAIVLYVVAMAAVIVGVDFVFFRNRLWERLTVNIGIVLVFATFYLRFLRRP